METRGRELLLILSSLKEKGITRFDIVKIISLHAGDVYEIDDPRHFRLCEVEICHTFNSRFTTTKKQ